MKKNVFLFKNCIFDVFFYMLLTKLYVLLIGAAIDFDNLMVFSPSHCQGTKLHFLHLYKFLVSIAK